MAKKAIFNWSGGKDSAFALYEILRSGEFQVNSLLTTVNGKANRVSMHGIREELLDLQTQSLGFPLHKINLPEELSMEEYDKIMKSVLKEYADKGIKYSVFGDIFLEDLRQYREERLSELGMHAVFPLWKRNTRTLLLNFIELGFKAITVCVNGNRLGKDFVGVHIDENFLKKIPENVDPCGEYGEFHSFVYDGPIFSFPVKFKLGNTVYREFRQTKGDTPDTQPSYDTSFWYIDLIPT